MTTPATAPPRPRVLVCEDGIEYVERFRRFLGDGFDFVPVQDCAAARAAAGMGNAIGILMDLDFSRAATGTLIDESGTAPPAPSDGERRRLAEVQGILILRVLRAEGVALPALLFADLDDPQQVVYLERTLAPVAVIPSSDGLPAIAARLRAWT